MTRPGLAPNADARGRLRHRALIPQMNGLIVAACWVLLTVSLLPAAASASGVLEEQRLAECWRGTALLVQVTSPEGREGFEGRVLRIWGAGPEPHGWEVGKVTAFAREPWHDGGVNKAYWDDTPYPLGGGQQVIVVQRASDVPTFDALLRHNRRNVDKIEHLREGGQTGWEQPYLRGRSTAQLIADLADWDLFDVASRALSERGALTDRDVILSALVADHRRGLGVYLDQLGMQAHVPWLVALASDPQWWAAAAPIYLRAAGIARRNAVLLQLVDAVELWAAWAPPPLRGFAAGFQRDMWYLYEEGASEHLPALVRYLELVRTWPTRDQGDILRRLEDGIDGCLQDPHRRLAAVGLTSFFVPYIAQFGHRSNTSERIELFLSLLPDERLQPLAAAVLRTLVRSRPESRPSAPTLRLLARHAARLPADDLWTYLQHLRPLWKGKALHRCRDVGPVGEVAAVLVRADPSKWNEALRLFDDIDPHRRCLSAVTLGDAPEPDEP